MKAERVVLSIIALVIGLVVAGGVFYFFQLSKNSTPEKKEVISILSSPSPTPAPSFISVTSPADESISATKSITLKGKAPAGSTIIISMENGQDVVITDEGGNFSSIVSLDSGVNLIHLTAIDPNGKEGTVLHTISYSTESF